MLKIKWLEHWHWGKSMGHWPEINEGYLEGKNENIQWIIEKCGIIHSTTLALEKMWMSRESTEMDR